MFLQLIEIITIPDIHITPSVVVFHNYIEIDLGVSFIALFHQQTPVVIVKTKTVSQANKFRVKQQSCKRL